MQSRQQHQGDTAAAARSRRYRWNKIARNPDVDAFAAARTFKATWCDTDDPDRKGLRGENSSYDVAAPLELTRPQPITDDGNRLCARSIVCGGEVAPANGQLEEIDVLLWSRLDVGQRGSSSALVEENLRREHVGPRLQRLVHGAAVGRDEVLKADGHHR